MRSECALFSFECPSVCSFTCLPKSDPAAHALKNIAYASVWISLSASVIMFNKYIISSCGFLFPVSLTLWHMTFSSLVATLLVRTGKVSTAEGINAQKYVTAILPIGALFACTLWLGNAAYMHLSVAFIQMLKALMPATVFCVGCFLGTESFSWKSAANMAVITFGVALASAGEINLVPIGIAMQLASVLLESIRLALVQILMQRRGLNLNPVTTLYYVAPASGLFLLIPWSVLEASRLRDTVMLGQMTTSPWMLFASAACAFALNLSAFLLVGKTSALTMNVAGVVKDWLLIGSSSVFFHTPITNLNLQGYSIAFSGVCWYNWTKVHATKCNAATPTASTKC